MPSSDYQDNRNPPPQHVPRKDTYHLALVRVRDDLFTNGTVNQPEVLVQQIGSVVLFGGHFGGRLASPFAIIAPQRLELLDLLILPRDLKVLVYRSP